MADANKVVVGKSDSGKTTLIKKFLIPQAVKAGNKIPIIDVEDEYSDVAQLRVEDPADFKEAFKQGHDVVRWIPDLKPPTKPTNLESNGERLDKALRKITLYQRQMSILVEEAHNFQSNRKIYSGNLFKVMKQGDKYGVNIMQASQEPQDFHRASWNNGGDIIAMRMRTTPDKLGELLDSGHDPTELDRYHYILIPSDPYLDVQEYPPISI